MPIKFPFVLKLSTALERHVSWNYLDFCGYFFSDWALRPDSSRHQYSQDQAVCAFTIRGCGLSQDFQSFLAAGEWLRLFSGNCCGHIRAQNSQRVLWHQDCFSLSPWAVPPCWWPLHNGCACLRSQAEQGWLSPLHQRMTKKSQGKTFHYSISFSSLLSARQGSFI